MKLIFVLLIILAILLLSSLTTFAQTNSLYHQSHVYSTNNPDTLEFVNINNEIPNINVGDIASQLLLSPISGMIFAILGGISGYIIDSNGHDGPSLAVVIGSLAGYSIGSAIGVNAVARKDKYDPDLLALIGSSLLGEIAGMILYRYSVSNTPNINVFAYVPFVLPPIFAMITLNAFQQKETNIKIGFDIQQLPQPNAFCYGIKFQYGF